MFTALTSLPQRLPGTCQVCGAWPSRPVCEPCATRFQGARYRCRMCATPMPSDTPSRCGACLARPGPPVLLACAAAVDYAYPWNRLIARFKFQGEPGWAAHFADRMLQSPLSAELLSRCDLAVPVPLTTTRLAGRGYNQAWELVKALKRLGRAGMSAHPMADALVRLIEAPDQHALPRERRLLNLHGVFAPHPLRLPRLAGSQILLVDDVTTTGATLQAAAQALLQAGAASVSALVFAATPPH